MVKVDDDGIELPPVGKDLELMRLRENVDALDAKFRVCLIATEAFAEVGRFLSLLPERLHPSIDRHGDDAYNERILESATSACRRLANLSRAVGLECSCHTETEPGPQELWRNDSA